MQNSSNLGQPHQGEEYVTRREEGKITFSFFLINTLKKMPLFIYTLSLGQLLLGTFCFFNTQKNRHTRGKEGSPKLFPHPKSYFL
jgi:hypothetical protein